MQTPIESLPASNRRCFRQDSAREIPVLHRLYLVHKILNMSQGTMSHTGSPLDRAFWNDLERRGRDSLGIKMLSTKPCDSVLKLAPLRDALCNSVSKFEFLPSSVLNVQNTAHQYVKEWLVKARQIYNNKANDARHKESLELVFKALGVLLGEQTEIRADRTLDINTTQRLVMLEEAFVLFDKNRAWLGVIPDRRLSTLHLAAVCIWIFERGLRNHESALKKISTLAYALIGSGHWQAARHALEWALSQPIQERATQRDLIGAMATLETRYGRHEEALKQYKETEGLDESQARDGKAHRQGTRALSILLSSPKCLSVEQLASAFHDLDEAIQELAQSRHTGFLLQLLRGTAEYHIRSLNWEHANLVVSYALRVLNEHPEGYRNQRARFLGLEEFLSARGRLGKRITGGTFPIHELIASAELSLIDGARISAAVLLTAALEAITVAMLLGQRIREANGEILAEDLKAVESMNLHDKNERLRSERVYAPDDPDRNNEMFEWIDAARRTRNRIFHGRPLAEEAMATVYHFDDFYLWYKRIAELLTTADEDIRRYYQAHSQRFGTQANP